MKRRLMNASGPRSAAFATLFVVAGLSISAIGSYSAAADDAPRAAPTAAPTTKSEAALTEVQERATREARDGREQRGGGGGGNGGNGARFGPMTEAERDEIRAFAKEHAPNRFQLFDMLPEGPGRMRIQMLLRARYRQLQNLKDDSPEIYQLNLKRFEAEDAAFGLARSVRANGNDAAVTNDAEQKLRDKVSEIVNIGFQERQKRIERLEAKLKDERDRLASEQSDVANLVDKQVKQFESTVDELRKRYEEFRRGRGGNRVDAATTEPSTVLPSKDASRDR